MKRSLRGLYWVAIACMLVMAVVAVALLLDFRVKDRSESLRDILEAVSAWTLESRDGLSLVECRLLTGRTHQIRVSMAEIGCPLLGDGKYGRGDVNRRYHETRQALYSYKLRFDFQTDAGLLSYLNGQEFTVETVPFREKYFPQTLSI